MRVLLTGASGDVGRGVYAILKEKGVDVVRISSKRRHGYVQWDLTADNDYFPAFDDTPFDAVISCVGGSVALNCILRFVKLHQIPHVVFMGSIVTEFQGYPDPYAKEKMKDERFVTNFCHAHDIQCSVICPAMVFDKGNNWDNKLNMFRFASPFICPFFRVYFTSSRDVGIAVWNVLQRPASKTIVRGRRTYLGDIYSYVPFFVVLGIVVALMLHNSTRTIGIVSMVLLVLVNALVLCAALVYKSPRILIT